jgi:prolyl 4-hydroxylase
MHELIKNHDWIVLKYDKSNFFKNHIDDSPSFSRTLSVLIYLNDEYTGGELVFDNFDVSYRPSAGDVVIFSSAFPYRHRVEEITDGVRYVIVNWFSYAKIEK